jgi:hypothetical protein
VQHFVGVILAITSFCLPLVIQSVGWHLHPGQCFTPHGPEGLRPHSRASDLRVRANSPLPVWCIYKTVLSQLPHFGSVGQTSNTCQHDLTFPMADNMCNVWTVLKVSPLLTLFSHALLCSLSLSPSLDLNPHQSGTQKHQRSPPFLQEENLRPW